MSTNIEKIHIMEKNVEVLKSILEDVSILINEISPPLKCYYLTMADKQVLDKKFQKLGKIVEILGYGRVIQDCEIEAVAVEENGDCYKNESIEHIHLIIKHLNKFKDTIHKEIVSLYK